MIVVIGLVVLLAAGIVGIVGVLGNAGPTHTLAGSFSVLGYHVTGSTGTLFFFGIVVGAVTLLGLSVLLAGARRTAGRAQDARRALRRSQRETAFLTRDRDTLLENLHSDADSGSMARHGDSAMTRQDKAPPLWRWVHGRHPTDRQRS